MIKGVYLAWFPLWRKKTTLAAGLRESGKTGLCEKGEPLGKCGKDIRVRVALYLDVGKNPRPPYDQNKPRGQAKFERGAKQ